MYFVSLFASLARVAKVQISLGTYNSKDRMKRLQKEFACIHQRAKEQGVVPTIKENLYHWQLLMSGPVDSPYEGYKFVLDIDFPQQFPFKFPQFRFRTPIYHPNIKDGQICQEMLGEKQWLPNKKVQEIIEVILGMLAHPDCTTPINNEAASQIKEGTFFKIAREKAEKQALK